MEILKNNKNIKVLFTIIWCFFIIRISSYIIFDIQVPLRLIKDLISGIIFIFLLTYLLFNYFKKRKISKTIILIIYPITGVIAYYLNGIENAYQESILIHHFLTLSSVFILFTLIQSNKIFDYKFKEFLFKIIIVFCIFFFIIKIFPSLAIKLYNFEDLRLSKDFVISIFGSQINFSQNINGQSKFVFILFLICLLFFKKFLIKKNFISWIFYFLSLFFITIIYLSQARFNFLSSIIISFFILINTNSLNKVTKLILIISFLIIPLSIFNFYTEKKSRFSNDYNLYYVPFENKTEHMSKIKNYNNEIINKDILELGNNIKNNIDNQIIKMRIDKKKIFLESLEKFIADYDSTKEFNYDFYIKSFETYKLIDLAINELVSKNVKYKSIPPWNLIDEDLIAPKPNDEIFNHIIKLKIFKRKLKNNTDNAKEIILRSCSEKIYFIDQLLSGRVCGWEVLLKTLSFKELFLGKGFFADQVYLSPLEKTSSNSYVNIIFNTGIVNLLILLFILVYFFNKFFRVKNINSENFYLSFAHYLTLYFIFRGLFEDTLTFVSIDFLLFAISLILIRQSIEEKNY